MVFGFITSKSQEIKKSAYMFWSFEQCFRMDRNYLSQNDGIGNIYKVEIDQWIRLVVPGAVTQIAN